MENWKLKRRSDLIKLAKILAMERQHLEYDCSELTNYWELYVPEGLQGQVETTEDLCPEFLQELEGEIHKQCQRIRHFLGVEYDDAASDEWENQPG